MSHSIYIFVVVLLMVQRRTAEQVRYGSTRGCDVSCQKECIEVINKYRVNHGAKKLKFSQSLANKAQTWADEGRFGYDMKSRGKYGQLIEWDVKDELQSFTSVIKHWHDKGKDFDFAAGRSKTGKTLHDFTQIVWKKARVAGCAQSKMFDSKYFVVWMDADSAVNHSAATSRRNVGFPKHEDSHWFEPYQGPTNKGSAGTTPERPLDENSSIRAQVELKSPLKERTSQVRSPNTKKPANGSDLNEVQEEQRVLNNNALLKQYLDHDSLSNIVLNENKETASYQVVSGVGDNATWQKAAESLIALGKSNTSTEKAGPDNGGDLLPLSEEEAGKQAAALQNAVKQQDENEDPDKTVAPPDGNSSDDFDEADVNQQAAEIQSMMKQEDEMIQRQGAGQGDDDDQSSVGNSTSEAKAPSSESNSTNSDNSHIDVTTTNSSLSSVEANINTTSSFLSSSKTQAETTTTNNNNNSSVGRLQLTPTQLTQASDQTSSKLSNFMNNSRANHNNETQTARLSGLFHDVNGGRTRPSWFFSAGVALNHNSKETKTVSRAKSVEHSLLQGNGSGDHEAINESSIAVHQTTGKFPLVVHFPADRAKSNISGTNTVVYASHMPQNRTSGNQSERNAPQVSVILEVDDKTDTGHQTEKLQQQQGTTDITNGSNANGNLGAGIEKEKDEKLLGLYSPTAHVQAVMVLPRKWNENMPVSGGSEKLTNTQQRKIAAVVNPGIDLHKPDVNASHDGQAVGEGYQAGMDDSWRQPGSLMNERYNSTTLDDRGNTLVLNPSGFSEVHQVSSPAVITLPKPPSRPIKLVFHVNGAKTSKQASADRPPPVFGATQAYSSKTDVDGDVRKMNDEECHDDTLQCHLWANHGHCRGTAYAEFMKRHCKETCGYCGLPSIIKQGIKQSSKIGLTQDEVCEDGPNFEFSCPRWRAQGYCEKREREMRVVCRKTCGFCAPKKTKSRLPITSHDAPGPNMAEQLKDQGPTIVKQPTTLKMSNPLLDKPALSLLQKNTTGVLASSGVQTSTNSPIKNEGNFLLQNTSKLPALFSLLKTFRSSALNHNRSSKKQNASESLRMSGKATLLPLLKIVLAKQFKLKALPTKPAPSVLESIGDSAFKQHDNLKLANTPGKKNTSSVKPSNVLKLAANLKLTNSTKQPLQMSDSLLPQKQSLLTSSLEVPIASNFKTIVGSRPHALLSLDKKAASQTFVSVDEDKVIREGLKALQKKLQAPLEISAVAKSNPGCRERLCKEKVKTQQAKTRETIGNSVTESSALSKSVNKPVSTKECDASCQLECLAAHNRYRLNHGAPPLTLDQTLANQAQQWANKKVFKHSPWAGGQGGETIALGSLYPSFTAAVKAWHDEEKDYDWSTGTGKNDMRVSHFTQVVWKQAKVLGCGMTHVNGEPYYITQMDTPGVIAPEPGYDKSNVGKPKEPDLLWFMESSPYWKEMQLKDSIPKDIEHLII